MIPTVSIIMAAYNAEKYISESIQSILNQTFENFELIIINDGSTDRTKEIVEEFCKKDTRIKLINNEKNLFVIKSRNIGIQSARGKYLAILDSDDLSYPERLEKQVYYLENNPEVFMIGASGDIIDENNNIIGELISTPDYNEIKRKIPTNNILYHSSMLFRNDNTKYREKMLYCEDYDLFLNAISEKKIIRNFEEKLFKYRILSNSLSRKDNQLIQWLFIKKAREFYIERLNNGTDSYNSFDPDEFYKIEDINYKNKKDTLIYALKICLATSNYQKLKFLSNKQKKYYPFSVYSFFYSTLSINKSIFNFIYKFYTKI